jgi:hypothetical protein
MRVSSKFFRPVLVTCALAYASLVLLAYSASLKPVEVKASADPFVTPAPTPTPTPSEFFPQMRLAYSTFFHDESGPAAVRVTHDIYPHFANTGFLTTTDGTATGGTSCGPGIDYVRIAVVVTLSDQEGARDVPIEICNDGIAEPPETINVRLTGDWIGEPSTAVLTIGDVPFYYSVSGRVRTAGGRGIWNAQLRVQGTSIGERFINTHGAFGWYTINDLRPGENYTVEVISAPRHTFTNASRFLYRLDRDYTDIDFTADP